MTMTLNDKGEIYDKSRIYFIDFGFMKKYTDQANINHHSINHQYPDILFNFNILKQKYNKTQKINKLELITLLNNQKKPDSIQSKLLEKTQLNKIDYSCFFHSLEDNTEYSPQQIYDMCIEPIAKNIDIYALSLFIYQLFFNIYSNINSYKYDFDNNPTTLVFLNELLINALYNNIDGPEELIYYLDEIIQSLKDNYIEINNIYIQNIKNKIRSRRSDLSDLKKPYRIYTKEGYEKDDGKLYLYKQPSQQQ